MGGCCGRLARGDTELQDVAPGYGKNRPTLMHQQKTWEATGVVSLRDSKLKVPLAPFLCVRRGTEGSGKSRVAVGLRML
jgi:hypothetical protein